MIEKIKAALQEQKKNGATTPKLKVELWSHRQGGKEWYTINIGKGIEQKCDNEYQVDREMSKLYHALNKLKETRGWGMLYIDTMTKGYSTIVVNSISLLEKPCSKFTSLVNYLNKYAKFQLKPTDIYSVSTFGKRGVYGESGPRTYIHANEKYCAKVLEWLRKHKASKDQLQITLELDENQEDKSYSEYYETECYGSKRYYLVAKVLTPSGKQKATEWF